MIQIENHICKIAVQEKGGELCSLFDKRTGKERLWQAGNPWHRHAPVLFPTIGGFAEGTYYVDGEPYQMTPHGFARDLDFAVVRHNEKEIVMELQDNEVTRAMYPFAFSLKVAYQLNDSRLSVYWIVENRDTKTMYYSIGAHPAFNLAEGTQLSDYELIFDRPVRLDSHKVVGRVITPETWPVAQEATDRLRLSADLLREDALIFDRGINEVVLDCTRTGEKLRMSFAGFPVLAIWTSTETVDQAKFLCIEPWCGIDDFLGQKPKEISEKYLVNSLSAGESKCFQHVIDLL